MSDQEPILTNRQGHPVRDNQNTITVGPKGPATLENYNFIEKLAHFDRERVPERVVHARGASAHGFFEAYGTIGDEPASKYTRAKLLQTKGQQTPVFVRFSTVIHSKDSPETLRDPRGFAVKFYTEDGNWDLVGNNLRVFFIRDAIKFPDFIHSFKPDPVTNRQEPNRQFDFISQTPESIHMITLLFSPRGIPANYREQEGAGVNTYKLVNDQGDAVLVKFHWIPKQGVRSLTTPEAAAIQKEEFSHATKDLYDAIDAGNFPEWEFCVQIMADSEHPELDFDPLDDTKQWPESQFPLRKVGRLVLNRKPENFFAESEQSAFGTGVKVDGIEFSADKMLQGRTFSYSDTQRYRVGPNYQQLPINAPKRDVHTNQRDGSMTRVQDAGGTNPHVNYEPSILGGVIEAPDDVTEYRPSIAGDVGQYVEDRTGDDQAGRRDLPCFRRSASQRPHREPGDQPQESRSANPAPHGLAFLARRRRLRYAGRRRPGHRRRTGAQTAAASQQAGSGQHAQRNRQCSRREIQRCAFCRDGGGQQRTCQERQRRCGHAARVHDG